MDLKERLAAELAAELPTVRELLVARYVQKYIDAVVDELAHSIKRWGLDDITKELSFNMTKVSAAAGRLKTGGIKSYLLTFMHQRANTSLVLEQFKGNVGKLSRVVINPKYKSEVMALIRQRDLTYTPISQAASAAAIQPNKDEEAQQQEQQVQDNTDNITTEIRVDLDSLYGYIQHTRTELDKPSTRDMHENYVDKLYRNLLIAQELLSKVDTSTDTPKLIEQWREEDCGRVYGLGMSLQRTPKEVRHAVLGPCWKYDFQACSYAVMASLALAIDPTLKVAGLAEYVKQRKIVRKRIAAEVGISETWMKDVFTSLGFGAQLKNSTYTAIRSKLGAEKYQRLVANQEFMDIKTALDAVSKCILNSETFKSDSFTLNDYTYRNIKPKDGTKRNNSQKLAWIYQNLESHYLTQFTHAILKDAEHPQHPALLTHDCVYFYKRLTNAQKLDAKVMLRAQCPLLTFEEEEITPIASKEYKANINSSSEEVIALATHHALIAEEERLAGGYKSQAAVAEGQVHKPSAEAMSDEEYERRRKQQFDLDIAMHNARQKLQALE